MCVNGQKKYFAFTLLRAWRAAALLVNMLKDSLEIDIKEIAFLITRTQYDQPIILRSQL